MRGHRGLYGGNEGQDSEDRGHYFIANEQKSGHLPVACVPRVEGSMGRVR